MPAPEEAQCVVLLGRQVRPNSKESILLDPQTVVRSPEMEKGLLLQRIEAPGFRGRRNLWQRSSDDMHANILV